MKIILRQDIEKLGQKDDVVTVKTGYARNYLIPNGLAIQATDSALKIHNENLKQRAHKEEKIRGEAEELAKKLAEVKLVIGAKVSSAGKIFGSVNNIQLAEALNEKGYEIDRRNILLGDDAIKEVGNYKAVVKLHRDVKVDLEFEVIAE
ncbi:MAG TPA: 50S ribosomal protein L9 [Bacteroidales bacterium]|jgi:large subunit ribosomal protein L9|nr:50S ribosomal protein L9 [Bacteroidales bacterium]MDI9532437.1 50S ribosomal protein L9 [Bacteroidota bacterium]MBK7731605.1 50S ribosomal protein L9 [Bacteroidales bacterium]MBP7035565.1 50S ribosomal protein L9 [Bacteroidales bacterium]MBP8709290.1 50S ribosomal protein L9 [Bacteroidales bacterium]